MYQSIRERHQESPYSRLRQRNKSRRMDWSSDSDSTDDNNSDDDYSPPGEKRTKGVPCGACGRNMGQNWRQQCTECGKYVHKRCCVNDKLCPNVCSKCDNAYKTDEKRGAAEFLKAVGELLATIGKLPMRAGNMGRQEALRLARKFRQPGLPSVEASLELLCLHFRTPVPRESVQVEVECCCHSRLCVNLGLDAPVFVLPLDESVPSLHQQLVELCEKKLGHGGCCSTPVHSFDVEPAEDSFTHLLARLPPSPTSSASGRTSLLSQFVLADDAKPYTGVFAVKADNNRDNSDDNNSDNTNNNNNNNNSSATTFGVEDLWCSQHAVSQGVQFLVLEPRDPSIRKRMPPAEECIIHMLRPQRSCGFCASDLIGEESSALCCFNGKRKLPIEDVELPTVFRPWFAEYSHLLPHYSRQINQLAAISTIGSESSLHGRKTMGGVQFPWGKKNHVAILTGRAFHFSTDFMFDLRASSSSTSSLSHLQANGSCYFTLNPGAVSAPSSMPSDVVQAAQRFRRLYSHYNSFIGKYKQCRRLLADDDLLSAQSRQAITFEHGAVQHPNASRVLASLSAPIFGAPPSVCSYAMNEETGFIKHWKASEVEYEWSVYPLIDPLSVSGWGYDNNERLVNGIPQSFSLRQFIRTKLMQYRHWSRIPQVQQEWLLDNVNRMACLAASGALTARSRWRQASVATIARSSAQQGDTIGRLFRVPESVRGSPAHRRLKVAQGMAQVRKWGLPNFFITMTGNPDWKEIQDELLRKGFAKTEWYLDVPLINRVFHQKLKDFTEQLKAGTFFGPIVYYQYVIEFQKRGMPHAHILVKTQRDYNTPDAVDSVCRCVIPDVPDDGEDHNDTLCGCNSDQCRLRRLVLTHMVHGCYKERCKQRVVRGETQDLHNCKYHFPQRLCSRTRLSPKGWELERHRGEDWIVEYNPVLLLRYECHINVKMCASNRAVYYLRKYMCKAPEAAECKVVPNAALLNEGEQTSLFFKLKQTCASEAVWECLGFKFDEFYPSSKPLNMWLPGEEQLAFPAGEHGYAVQEKRDSDLEEYFARPLDPSFASVLFKEYYEEYHFTTRAAGHTTVGKKQRRVCGNDPLKRHLWPVCFYKQNVLRDQELMAMSLLLDAIPARCYDDLKQGHPTFLRAAVARGLIPDDALGPHIATMRQMHAAHMPSPMMIGYWRTVVSDFGADAWMLVFRHPRLFCDRHADGSPVTFEEAVAEVARFFLYDGIDIMEQIPESLPNEIRSAFLSAVPSTDSNVDDFYDNMRDVAERSRASSEFALNCDQRAVLQSLLTNTDRNMYLNGSAGCGKTTVLSRFVSETQNSAKVLCCAFTGLAASLLPGGVTCHRLFNLPVEDESEGASAAPASVSAGSLQSALLEAADVIVVDEVSMLNKDHLESIDECLRQVCGQHNVPFGGKRVILAGDYKQLAPVVKVSSSAPISLQCVLQARASCVASSLWESFKHDTLSLTKSERFAGYRQFETFVERLGLGQLQPGCDSKAVDLPREVERAPPSEIDELISNSCDCDRFITPLYAEARSLNQQLFLRFHPDCSTHSTYNARIETKNGVYRFSLDQAREVDKSGFPPHTLTLAEMTPVILLRNLCPSQGLANGTRLTVLGCKTNFIKCRIDGGCFDGSVHCISRIRFAMHVGVETFNRVQFPVVPCYAMTINKCQGLTARRGRWNIFLQTSVFSHGQLYVALTRVVRPSQLRVIANDSSIDNVVSHVLLDRAGLTE